MKISLNWLKKFAKIDAANDELFTRIGARLVEIESVENLAEKYRDVVVAKVISCAPHPDSDHMHVLKLDDACTADAIVARNIAEGNATEKDRIPRDEKGRLVTVVCGAPNVREGLTVAWLPPTSIVPADETFRLSAKKLRGVVSYGMCAAPDELGLWDEHDGILELPDDWNAGDNFSQKLELNDQILEVENKSLTHRPDTFGIIGFAREVAAIFGEKSTDPDWFTDRPADKNDQNFAISAPKVDIENPAICARYEGVVIKNADGAAQSSLLRKTYLARSGVRPISAIVDITNYLMLLTGQPLHAFDYDKLCAVSPTNEVEIVVRTAKKGEKLRLLDDREIELDEKDIVIAAGNREDSVSVALAGAMGGKSTEIDENTRNIFIESATFNLYNLRGTQFRHGIFSEAITRFTKGQPAALTDPVLREAIREFAQIGGEQASSIADNYANNAQNPAIEISANDVNSVLGAQYTDAEIREVLQNLGYSLDENFVGKSAREVIAPWWRTDVKICEDAIEDVGRVRGFDDIPLDLPTRKFTAVANQPLYDLQRKAREILKSFGANEVLTYSFISQKLAENVGQDPENSYKVINAISPDLQLVRQSLTPKLLEKTRENLRAGYDNFALFEFGQTFSKNDSLTDERVPVSANKLALAIVAKNRDDASYYVAKKIANDLLDRLNIKADFRANSNIENPYEPKRTAEIYDDDDNVIGCVGELKTESREKLKLPKFTAIFELDLDDVLIDVSSNPAKYQPLAKFSGTSRDLTFSAKSDTNFAKIEHEIESVLRQLPENIRTELTAKDIFAPDDEHKNFTFHLEIWDLERTIDVKIVANLVEQIASALAQNLDAKMI